MAKIALVTGGAKRVGGRICRHLAENGWFVWVHFHASGMEAAETVRQIEIAGGSAKAIEADLSCQNAVDAMFQSLIRERAVPNLLINNAAVFPKKRLQEASFDCWNDTFRINLRAPWYCSQWLYRICDSSRDNLIINIADSAAKNVLSAHGLYGVTKNSLLFLTKALAEDFSPKVRVNSISPWFILRDDHSSCSRWEQLRDRADPEELASKIDILQGIDAWINNKDANGLDAEIYCGLE